jgi:CheY-like chemotaxis protein
METSVLIFVVDDDQPVLEFLQVILEDAGYEVTTASDGAEAMAILEEKIPQFRALITDITLSPGTITGWDIARRARAMNPALPVVYMTGGNAHEWASKGVPHSVLLTKPFAPSQAVTAIRACLI